MTLELRGKVDQGRCSICGATGRVVHSYYGPELCGACCVDESARLDRDGWPLPLHEWPADPAIVVIGCPFGVRGGFGAMRASGHHRGADFTALSPAGDPRAWHGSIAPNSGAALELWIHPSADVVLGWPGPAEFSGVDPWVRLDNGDELVRVAAFGSTHPRTGVYRNGSPWWVDSPLDLYANLCAFSAAVGRRWHVSGAVTSDHLIWDHWGPKIKPAELPDVSGAWSSTTLEGPAFSVVPVAGARTGRGKWLYAFDLNANYLGAASNLALPTGPARAGVYTSAPDSKMPPGYWTRDHDKWVTTPSIEHTAGAFQGYSYPEHHQYLQPWFKTLRDARARLVPGPALDAVKGVYRGGWARLMSPNRSDSDFSRRLYQPYWGQAVQANARERLGRRLAELPVTPAAVDTDAIFVFSSRGDARICALELGLTIGAGLGEWHVLGRIPARAARQVLEGDTSEAAMVATLRRLVKATNP